jgi:hypothetical protein
LSYFTVNSFGLRYEPNRLILSIGLRRCYINITITIPDFIHRPVLYTERERERERKKVERGGESHYNSGGGGNNIFGLKVPRHCPLVLPYLKLS